MGSKELWVITSIMEKQMEKNIENDWERGYT